MQCLSQIYVDDKGLDFQEKCKTIQLETTEHYLSSLLNQKQIIELSSLMDTFQGQFFVSQRFPRLKEEMHFHFRSTWLDSQNSMYKLVQSVNFSWDEEKLVKFFAKNKWLKKDEHGLWFLEGEGLKFDKDRLYQFFFKDKLFDILKILAIYEAHLFEINERIFKSWKKECSKCEKVSTLLPLFYSALVDKLHRQIQRNRSSISSFLQKKLLNGLGRWGRLKNENPMMIINQIMESWRKKLGNAFLQWFESCSNLVLGYILETNDLFEKQWALFLEGPKDFFAHQEDVLNSVVSEERAEVSLNQKNLFFVLEKYQSLLPYWEVKYFESKIMNLDNADSKSTLESEQNNFYHLQNEMIDASMYVKDIESLDDLELNTVSYYNSLGVLIRVMKSFENQDKIWCQSLRQEMQRMQRLSFLFEIN